MSREAYTTELSDTDRQRFMDAFRGSFTSALRWPQLDDLWQAVRMQREANWYIYAVGESPPTHSASRQQLHHFIEEVDSLLRREHGEEYCGIVYADNLQQPAFVKIYDPNNLGVSCGFSDNPPLPGWVLSTLRPCDLHASVLPANRKRWWRRLFR